MSWVRNANPITFSPWLSQVPRRYGVAHESFAWGVRQEPGVIDAFAKVYDTEDLIVSFDGVNLAYPRSDLKKNTPWPHQDQDPEKPGFRCLQGLVNLLPNGDNDGGLIVCKVSLWRAHIFVLQRMGINRLVGRAPAVRGLPRRVQGRAGQDLGLDQGVVRLHRQGHEVACRQGL